METKKVLIDGAAMDKIQDIARRLFHDDKGEFIRTDVLYRALHVYLQAQGIEPNFDVRTSRK
jgi:hypothetical protein